MQKCNFFVLVIKMSVHSYFVQLDCKGDNYAILENENCNKNYLPYVPFANNNDPFIFS